MLTAWGAIQKNTLLLLQLFRILGAPIIFSGTVNVNDNIKNQMYSLGSIYSYLWVGYIGLQLGQLTKFIC